MVEENDNIDNFKIKVNDKSFSISVGETNVLYTTFKVASEGKYLCTLIMNEEGNWKTESGSMPEYLIEMIGRAIEEHDEA